MAFFQTALDFLLHLDTHLNGLVLSLGPWFYLLVFLVVFCETGLVVTPFLPGDSFFFALGALTSVENAALSYPLLLILGPVAAILGNATNYTIGHFVGPRIFNRQTGFLLNQKHLQRAQSFYEKYGGKTIFLAQFMPIVRTFAPFVAGVGKMKYPRFALFNVTGALVWSWSFLTAGRFFGNLPWVKDSFHIVIFAIIGISFLPVVLEWLKAKRAARVGSAANV